MPRFAANLSLMFAEYPFLDRFRAAAEAGFSEVEFLYPYEHSAEQIAEQLETHALKLVLFNLPPGDWDTGERGLACIPGRAGEFDVGLSRALDYAKQLSVPRLHAMAGIKPVDINEGMLKSCFVDNIAKAANRAAITDVDILIEPIAPTDMVEYFLSDFGTALSLIDEIAQRGGTPPKLLFDIYHCQRIHGNVPEWIERCAPYTAHYQIAGTPGRNEPDNGDLPLVEIIQAVEKFTPELSIAGEYKPTGKTVDGLGWRDSFCT